MPIYENRRMAGEYNISDSGSNDEIAFDDDYFEVRVNIFLTSIENRNPKDTKI